MNRRIARPVRLARTVMRATLTLVTAAVLLPGAAHAQRSFTSLTVFGDSFSDTGNLRAINPLLSFAIPFRQSNGDVWTDYFARYIGRGADAAPAYQPRRATGNYSVAGARTTTQPSFPVNTPSIPQQVQRWVGGASGGVADATGLYTVFGGANDIRNAGGLADAAQREAVTVAAARSIAQQAGLLADRGAGFVLIPNTVNLGLVPEVQGIPNRPAILTELSALFNATLAEEIALLRASRPSTMFFDFASDVLFDNVLADAARGGSIYGLTNVTTPCRSAGAPSCDISLFWDDLHPTTRAHEFVARAIFDRVVLDRNVSPVPEPATVALLAVGVVALGVAGRRRRAMAA